MLLDEKILDSIKGIHPAISIPFDVLLENLELEVQKGNISVLNKENLRLYNYTVQCMFDGNWNVYTLISRGLILDIQNKKVVCLSIPKFFNCFEVSNANIPNIPFSVYTKYDGSCLFVWYNGEWNTSTRGSFSSEQANWAKEYLLKNINYNNLNKNYTYVCEVIYPENRIVIPYKFSGLVLLVAYDNISGKEINHSDLLPLKDLGFMIAEKHDFNSIDDIVKICETLPANEEGFVVRFEDGYRLKIKGESYLAVHRLISNITPIHVWECLLNCENMDSIRLQLPEELRFDFDSLVKILNDKFNLILNVLSKSHEGTKHLSDKELGLKIKNNELGDYDCIKYCLFPCRKYGFPEQAFVGSSKLRKMIFNLFYPKGNKLDGYKKSTAFNRFTEDL